MYSVANTLEASLETKLMIIAIKVKLIIIAISLKVKDSPVKTNIGLSTSRPGNVVS